MTHFLRRALPTGLWPAGNIVLAELAAAVQTTREHPHPVDGVDVTCHDATLRAGRLMGPVLMRLAEELDRHRELRARLDALAEQFTRYVVTGLLDESAGGDDLADCPAAAAAGSDPTREDDHVPDFSHVQSLPELLAHTPAGTPVIVVIGDRTALAGAYERGAAAGAVVPDAGYDVRLAVAVPPCRCAAPITDLEGSLGCPQCFPQAPPELLALAARAVAASRDLPHGAAPAVDGCTAEDVTTAQAVLTVLLRPGSHVVW